VDLVSLGELNSLQKREEFPASREFARAAVGGLKPCVRGISASARERRALYYGGRGAHAVTAEKSRRNKQWW
jgi:hypothetical protein